MMALAINTVPVLTDDVADNFVRQSDYNAKHLAGSEYSADKEAWCLGIIALEAKNKNVYIAK